MCKDIQATQPRRSSGDAHDKSSVGTPQKQTYASVVYEGTLEALKNLLLVVQAEKVSLLLLQTLAIAHAGGTCLVDQILETASDASGKDVWALTWTVIDSVCPHIRSQLPALSEAEPAASEQKAAASESSAAPAPAAAPVPAQSEASNGSASADAADADAAAADDSNGEAAAANGSADTAPAEGAA